MSEIKDVYSRITGKIIADLEQGVRPRMKPWSSEHAAGRISRPLRRWELERDVEETTTRGLARRIVIGVAISKRPGIIHIDTVLNNHVMPRTALRLDEFPAMDVWPRGPFPCADTGAYFGP